MDTLERRLPPPLPAMPPPMPNAPDRPPPPIALAPLPRPAARRRPVASWFAVVLALALVGAGVVAIMQTSALSGARTDLRSAQAHADALGTRIDALEDRLRETKDELETAKDDLGRAHVYGAACREAVRGMDDAFRLLGESGIAFTQGDIDGARLLARDARSALHGIKDHYLVCVGATPTPDAQGL